MTRKWKSPPTINRVDEAGAAPGRRKILVVSNQVPGHDLGLAQSGAAHYVDDLLVHLHRAGYQVVLLVLRPNVDFVCRPVKTLDYALIGPSFLKVGRWMFLRAPDGIVRLLAWNLYVRLPRVFQSTADALRIALRKARGYVHTLGHFASAREIQYVRRLARTINPDVVIYDGIFNSCGRLNAAQHWVLTHDVKHQRAASFKEHGISVAPATLTQETERAILNQSGNVIAIQWDDAKEFKRLTSGSRVVVMPATVALPQGLRRGAASAGRCLFVGSGSYHNYHGIRWFLDECWPKILAAMPDATLDVVGSVCFRLSGKVPGVSFHGVVNDLADVYAAASVTVVPLQIGSGLKVKLIEALVREQAIVTTSVGAQGMMDFLPRPFVVADSSAAFAAEAVTLLNSPARQSELRAEAARCAGLFAPEAAFAEFDAALSGDLALA